MIVKCEVTDMYNISLRKKIVFPKVTRYCSDKNLKIRHKCFPYIFLKIFGRRPTQ